MQPAVVPDRYNSVHIDGVAEISRRIDSKSALLLDGNALSEAGIRMAGAISRYSGCRILCPTFPARVDSVKAVPIERMPYLPEQVSDALSSVRRLVLVGASEPVSLFAYEGVPSELTPENCELIRLSHRNEDSVQALALLLDALGVAMDSALDIVDSRARPDPPRGPITLSSLSQVLASLVPDGSILSTDSGGGAAAFSALQGVVSHTWLSLTGGAIGQGGPVALGASIACPDRTVFALLGDGGAMYTVQYLWSAAREKCKVVTIILNNRSYNILDFEYGRIRIEADDHRAGDVFALKNPDLDWISQARALGVPGARVETCEALVEAIREAMDTQGPYLIDALL
jgi:acetolactate synthase-1/2/3 large subunit